MKKRIISGVAMAGIAAYLFTDKGKRKQYIDQFKKTAKSITSSDESEGFPIEEAGKPETDNPENAKMVDEGSQYGVTYYNKVKNEE
ncbi:hypothetical protein GCM10011351_02740 [Paraliobacillus quinghaiensis]|uniref:YbyB n=1 Tax=Paraliobacillus quinghaiensis TaxID=470815 RepID=A0A917TEM8_9BACI|nr:hypothetical protein [Paraliobacillus quinghaiensis]GGM20360.1 hypothetical protein GCM10011351_02740 [Paraliobacillus quinghaiensis]